MWGAKFSRDIFTGLDGGTYDLGRVLLTVVIFVGLALVIYSVGWKGAPFDVQAFGVGMGGLLFGGGGMLWMKKDTEPKPPLVTTQENTLGSQTTTVSQDSTKGPST